MDFADEPWSRWENPFRRTRCALPAHAERICSRMTRRVNRDIANAEGGAQLTIA
jgi:hypothetical protein